MTAHTATEPPTVRLGLSVIALCCTAAGLYALLRVGQSLMFNEADPAMVIWSEHSGFFWRMWIVLYVGGVSGPLVWLASARPAHAQRIAFILTRVVPASAALLAAQALLVP